VRIPAYRCGIVGLRVGLGRIPSFNPSATIAPPISAQLMATQGPLTRTVRDARVALMVMAKGGARDTRWAGVPLAGPPPMRPIRVAIVPDVPGGATHPAQADAVRTAGRHLAAAGFAVEETLPPDFEKIVRLWHVFGSNDIFRTLSPAIERYGDADSKTSLREWIALCPPSEPGAVLDALARRDQLLRIWQTWFQTWPLVILPTLCGLPPPFGQDLARDGQAKLLDSLRASFVPPMLGLPGLAVPVGTHGTLRTGVQIVAGRFREDLTLDAGEVIEAAEGAVAPIDPAW